MTDTIKKSDSEIAETGEQAPFSFNRMNAKDLSVIGALDIEEEMIGLYHSISTILSETPKKMIQFIGSHKGEGATALVREFARVSAITFGKSVLLLDADPFQTASDLTVAEQEENMMSYIENGIPLEQAFEKPGGYRLSVCPMSTLGISLPVLFTSPHISRFTDKLKQTFDLILIDSLPMSASPDGAAIAAKVDGIILVVGAETTRWPVVGSVKEKLVKAGGNILGVILNKQRYYIPSFIYNRL